MPISISGAVVTVSNSVVDGSETVPVLMSAIIATAELLSGANGGTIDADFTTATLSGVTQAANGSFTTSAAHNLVVGDKVFIAGAVGMTQINNRSYIVASISATTFTLTTERGTSFVSDAVNTSGYTAWVSGGSVYRLLMFGQLIGIQVNIGTSAWFKVDDSYTWTARTSTRLNPQAETGTNANNGGATVLGYRSASIIATTSNYNDANCLAAANGGRFFALRTKNGHSPSITRATGIRNDWPTLPSGYSPAEYRIEGLFVRSASDSRKWYGGLGRNA